MQSDSLATDSMNNSQTQAKQRLLEQQQSQQELVLNPVDNAIALFNIIRQDSPTSQQVSI